MDLKKMVAGIKGEGTLIKSAGEYYVNQNLVRDIGWTLGEMAEKVGYQPSQKIKFRLLIEKE